MHEKCTTNKATQGELERAFATIDDCIRDGLLHGYFECIISCKTEKGQRRELILKAGKSYKFTIQKEDIKN